MNWSISLLFVCVLFTKSCCGEEVYVTAFPNGVPCPSYAEICHNMSYYSAQVNDIGDNTDVIFLEGIHQLPSEGIVIQNVVNVTIRGVENGSASVLQCSESGGIVFVFTEYVSIAQLTFNNCGTTYNDSEASIVIYESVFVNVSSVIVQNSTHSGLIFSNVLNISISKSVLIRNGYSDGIFGMFQDSAYMTGNGYVDIEETSVSSGTSGLHLVFSQQSYLVNCKIKSSHFMNSSGCNVDICADKSCQYNLNFDQIVSSYALIGIGFLANNCVYKLTPVIILSNSTISYNNIGFNVDWNGNDSGELLISSSSFIEQMGIGVFSALAIQQRKQMVNGNYLKVTLRDSQFHQNYQSVSLIKDFMISEQAEFTIFFNNINQIEIVDCTFTNNVGSAIFVYDSVVTFLGNNTFMNNTGVNGGGLVEDTLYCLLKHIYILLIIMLNSMEVQYMLNNNYYSFMSLLKIKM